MALIGCMMPKQHGAWNLSRQKQRMWQSLPVNRPLHWFPWSFLQTGLFTLVKSEKMTKDWQNLSKIRDPKTVPDIGHWSNQCLSMYLFIYLFTMSQKPKPLTWIDLTVAWHLAASEHDSRQKQNPIMAALLPMGFVDQRVLFSRVRFGFGALWEPDEPL